MTKLLEKFTISEVNPKSINEGSVKVLFFRHTSEAFVTYRRLIKSIGYCALCYLPVIRDMRGGQKCPLFS